jgi:hypothetical protein
MPVPNDPSWRFQGRLGVSELLRIILAAVERRQGFSLIRLGCSEGIAMAWPDISTREELASHLFGWFGPQDFSDQDRDQIAQLARSSVLSADVIGLPTRAQMEKDIGYPRVFEAVELHDLQRHRPHKCDANIHWYLQFSGAIASIVRDRDFIGLIGCREIDQELMQTFNVASTRSYLVRGEEGYKGSVLEPHWPTGFSRIRDQLEVPYPGAIFLVGAGVLGKAYCEMVKQQGGVALDIGSLFDSWASVTSRLRFGRFPQLFSLDHCKTVIEDAEARQQCMDRYIVELGLETATY